VPAARYNEKKSKNATKNLKTPERRTDRVKKSERNAAAARYNEEKSENGGSTNEKRRQNSTQGVMRTLQRREVWETEEFWRYNL
jgi:hypothetical protein